MRKRKNWVYRLKIREVKSLCEHEEITMYLQPVSVKNKQMLSVSCWGCRMIRLYDMDTQEVTTAFHNHQYYSTLMCTGEGDVMYVMHNVKGDRPVLKFNTEEIPLTGPSTTIQSGMEMIFSIDYIPAPHRFLVLIKYVLYENDDEH